MSLPTIRSKHAGLFVAFVITGTVGFAQAPQTTTQAPQTQGGRAGRGGGLAPIAPSLTFARIQARSYEFKDGAAPIQMTYEVFVPSKYDASKPTPLVVALHGLGSNPTQVIRYQGLTDEAEARGWLVVAPMGYNSGGWYGSQGPGRPRTGGGRGDQSAIPENLGELSEKDVMNVLALVQKEFNTDKSRTYLFGHSMGGGGTYYIGMKYKDIWAALAPAAPAIYTSPDQLDAIKDKPIIVVQGDNDNLVDVEVTRRWIEKMKSLGMNYEYIEVPGGDHTAVIARSPQNMKRVFDFLEKAKKN